MGRRIPKQAITGFKFQNETDNIRPFLSIRIRGKDERRLLKHALANVILSIISVAAIIALFTLIQN